MATQGLVALLVSLLARPGFGAPSYALTQMTLAAAGPRVAVLVVPMDLRSSQQQGSIEAAAEAALEKAGRFNVVPVQDAFSPVEAKKRADMVALAREKLVSGKKDLDDLDNVKATADFKEALEFLQQADLSREFPAMIDAWTMKAASHATGGETAPAKKDIEAVIALTPRAEFSPTYFSPDFLKYADAQKKQAANAKGQLLVKTEPAGARVWVDGQFRGVSPITLDGLSAGKHFVTAVAGGYALMQSQVSPGETELELTPSELAADWKKAILDIKRAPEADSRDTAAQSVAMAAKVDQVLLVIAKKSTAGDQLEFITARIDAADGHNYAYATGTLNAGDPDALGAFFDGLAATDAKRDGKNPVHHYPGAGGLDGKKIATYGLLGGGALLVVTAIILGSVALVFHNEYVSTPQTRSLRSTNELRTQGRALALTTDILYGVGGAAIIGGGVLFALDFFGNKAPAKPISSSSTNDTQKSAAPKKSEEPKPVEKKQEVKETKTETAPAAEEKPKEPVKEEKPAEEPPPKKLSKKEQAALEKKEREEAARQKKEDEKRAKEEEKRRQEEEREAAKKKKEEEKEAARQKKEDEKRAREDEKAAAQRAKEDEAKAAEQKKADEAAAKKKAEDDAKAAEEAAAKKKEEDKKKKDGKKPEDDHDDLRNY